MRTKTLLLTAALVAAGAASSMAQVYSVNVVGYINKSLPKGFYMVANQLDNKTGNKAVDLIPTPPNNTFLYKFNGTGYDSIDYVDGAWEGDFVDTMTLAPGEGAFISSPAAHNVTFVGEVVNDSDITVPVGFSIRSSVIPQSSGLDTLLYPASENDFVYQFNNATGAYISNDYVDGAWEGDGGGAAPTPAVGEAFFISHPPATGVKHWVRHFTP
jgi:hypothetical protein